MSIDAVSGLHTSSFILHTFLTSFNHGILRILIQTMTVNEIYRDTFIRPTQSTIILVYVPEIV
jgi:hypothetical protein